MAFSLMDGDPHRWNGWIFAYDSQDLTKTGYPYVYATTPQKSPVQAIGGGVWQGGAGLASDAAGYIYFTTGDGTFDLNSGGSDAGDSFVKLTKDLQTISGYFAPSDQLWRSCLLNDADLGSGGVTILPDNLLSSPYSYLAVNADKEGAIWLVDRTSPGSYNQGSCDQTSCPNTQACTPANQSNGNVQTIWTNPANFYHTALAYWNSNLYVAGSNLGNSDVLVQYPICGAGAGAACSCTTGGHAQIICPGPYNASTATFPWGASPTVSSNGTSNGIVWVIESDGSYLNGKEAVLHAFNAQGSSGALAELYNSDQCYIGHVQKDKPGSSTKFSVPTIANGYVYIGTQTDFDIYGPVTQRNCQTQ